MGPTHWPPISTTLPLAEIDVERSAADPVARLEHDHAPGHDVQRGLQPGEAGTDDDDVDATSAWDRGTSGGSGLGVRRCCRGGAGGQEPASCRGAHVRRTRAAKASASAAEEKASSIL